MDVAAQVETKARAAKTAARALALASTRVKNEALHQMARGLDEKAAAVLDANRSDLERARTAGLRQGKRAWLIRAPGPSDSLVGQVIRKDQNGRLRAPRGLELFECLFARLRRRSFRSTRQGRVDLRDAQAVLLQRWAKRCS